MFLLTTLMYPESLYSHKLMFRNQKMIGFHNEFRGFILKIDKYIYIYIYPSMGLIINSQLEIIYFVFYIYLGVKLFSKMCYLHLTFELFLGFCHL